MAKRKSTADAELRRTAIHEAGHAVLQIQLLLGCRNVTIAPNDSKGECGHAQDDGDAPTDPDGQALQLLAPEAFNLRHAVACYAGAEAVRRTGWRNWRAGAKSDFRAAAAVINRITPDAKSIDLLFALAKRRCEILVKHHWPEIRALAAALLKSHTMTGDEVRKVLNDSQLKRRSVPLDW